MSAKKTVLTGAALWICFWLAGLAGGFFGFSSPQGMVGSGVFFLLMAAALPFIQKKVNKAGDS